MQRSQAAWMEDMMENTESALGIRPSLGPDSWRWEISTKVKPTDGPVDVFVSEIYCLINPTIDPVIYGGIVDEKVIGPYGYYEIRSTGEGVLGGAQMLWYEVIPPVMWRAEFPFTVDKVYLCNSAGEVEETLATNVSSFMMYLYRFFPGEEYLCGATIAGSVAAATTYGLGWWRIPTSI